MSARDIVGGLAGAAVSAARKPLVTTAQAVGLAKGVVTTGAAAAEGIAHHAADRMRRHQVPPVRQSEPAPVDSGRSRARRAGRGSAEARCRKAAKKAPGSRLPSRTSPSTTARRSSSGSPRRPLSRRSTSSDRFSRPRPRQEQHGGRAGEPRGASRDEEHGEASLQRAEIDEIAEETAEALPGGDVDVETPVGTTGAGVGYNPDTAEADLQQPQTQPLVDPALTKQVKAAARTGKKASTKTAGTEPKKSAAAPRLEGAAPPAGSVALVRGGVPVRCTSRSRAPYPGPAMTATPEAPAAPTRSAPTGAR